MNHALKSNGLKELTAPQLKLFEDWWNRYLDIMLGDDPSKDDCLFYMFFSDNTKATMKRESGLVRDKHTTTFKPLDKS